MSVLFQPLVPGADAAANIAALTARNRAILVADNYLNKGNNIKDLTPTTPMAVENIITAQMNYYADNDQNVRSRTFFQATPLGPGWYLSLIARIIRIIVRTLGMPISVSVAAFQQSRYGKMTNDSGATILQYHLVVEDLKRVWQEYVDLGMTLLSGGIGTVNTFVPTAISTEFLFNFYNERVQLNEARNNQFAAAKQAYDTQQTQRHQAWTSAANAVRG